MKVSEPWKQPSVQAVAVRKAEETHDEKNLRVAPCDEAEVSLGSSE